MAVVESRRISLLIAVRAGLPCPSLLSLAASEFECTRYGAGSQAPSEFVPQDPEHEVRFAHHLVTPDRIGWVEHLPRVPVDFVANVPRAAMEIVFPRVEDHPVRAAQFIHR